jgi:hypothetical protein
MPALRAGASTRGLLRPAICSSRCAARITTAMLYVEEVLRKGRRCGVANDSETVRERSVVVPDTLEALQSTASWALEAMGRRSDRRDGQRG